MSVSSISLTSRTSKRRIEEIDDTINDLAESFKDMQDMELHSKLLGAKLKKQKLVALQAVAKSQIMLAEMEVLIAENELNNELAQLKNCKKLKSNINDFNKKERSNSKKPQSKKESSKKQASSDTLLITENGPNINMLPSPVKEKNKSNSSLNNLKISCSQEYVAADKNAKVINIQTPTSKEDVSCSVDKIANDNLHQISSPSDKLVRNKPLSPPNTHTKLNNISNVLKPHSSRYSPKHTQKNSTQNINNSEKLFVNISKNGSNKHGRSSLQPEHFKMNYYNNECIENNRSHEKRNVPHPIHIKKSIEAKQSNREKVIDVGKKKNAKNNANPVLHLQIINDLFKEIIHSKSEELISYSVDSNETPLYCFKCGLVNEDHMCEYTIREILENC